MILLNLSKVKEVCNDSKEFQRSFAIQVLELIFEKCDASSVVLKIESSYPKIARIEESSPLIALTHKIEIFF
jgi:hypothetical protein